MTRIARVARIAGGAALFFLGLSLPASLAFSSLGLAGAAFCALVVLAVDSASRRALRPLRWLGLAVGLWISSYVVAAALSEQPHWRKIADELWTRLLLFVPLILLADQPKWLRRNLHWMLTSATVVAAFAISQHFHGRDIWRGGYVNRYGDLYQSVGFFGHHLSYGGHVLVMGLIALAGLFYAQRRRLIWLTLTLIFVVALAWTFSRSAQLGFLAGACYLAMVSPVGRRRWKFMALAAVVLVAILLPDVRDRTLSLFDVDQEPTRILLWRTSFDAFLSRPVFGFGPGNFGVVLRDFRQTGFYDSTAHSHSDYLMLLMNGGLLALGAFACTVIALYRALGRGGQDCRFWREAARAVLIAILVAGLFQFYQADDEVEFALFFLFGHALALGEGTTTASAESRGA